MSQTADISLGSKRGFTLVEMLVAMAIFTILMAGIMTVFSSVTNTVRRSYRTMNTFEATHGVLMTLERDVQTAFSAPATGADFHFYGEPNGFVFVGIAPDGNLGRLTYAVHADTSRIQEPYSTGWRGEMVTLPRKWADMAPRYPDGEFAAAYPNPASDEYVEVEMEVVFGVLTRYYEEYVNEVMRFPELEKFAREYAPPYLPLPALFRGMGDESAYRGGAFPWVVPYVFKAARDNGVPWYIQERMEVLEVCHYWIQMLNGPRIMPAGTGTFGWDDPYAIWNVSDVVDQFWYDHLTTGIDTFDPNPDNDRRHFLWDHVIARDFVVAAWLIDPGTGQRIRPDINAVHIAPVFQYSVESGLASGHKEANFNTLFNLNFEGAFDDLMLAVTTDINNKPPINTALNTMTTRRDFYDLGNPLASRLPSAFEVNLFVISPPVTTSAPTDVFHFSQTIHLPSGFLRRNLAVD